jgi:hypothetical protein
MNNKPNFSREVNLSGLIMPSHCHENGVEVVGVAHVAWTAKVCLYSG